uniref:Uncharacterized protein n=1 Tax=Cacopsylla melanoneura TaxID=428564 RepID=A0A8D9ACX8_9HEMI
MLLSIFVHLVFRNIPARIYRPVSFLGVLRRFYVFYLFYVFHINLYILFMRKKSGISLLALPTVLKGLFQSYISTINKVHSYEIEIFFIPTLSTPSLFFKKMCKEPKPNVREKEKYRL